MNSRRTTRSLLCALCATPALLLGGCSSGPPPVPNATTPAGFPAEAMEHFASVQGQLEVELRLSPQPPVAGLNTALYTITDATSHAAVEGLSLSIVPWMPAMGHGTSVVPEATDMGAGQYVITDLSLFMAGEWQLRTTFSGEISDSAEPTFDVP